MFTPEIIVQVKYPNGAYRTLRTNKASGYYTETDATGKAYRVGVKRAQALVEEFDFLCNEGKVALVTIDDRRVNLIRRGY